MFPLLYEAGILTIIFFYATFLVGDKVNVTLNGFFSILLVIALRNSLRGGLFAMMLLPSSLPACPCYVSHNAFPPRASIPVGLHYSQPARK